MTFFIYHEVSSKNSDLSESSCFTGQNISYGYTIQTLMLPQAFRCLYKHQCITFSALTRHGVKFSIKKKQLRTIKEHPQGIPLAVLKELNSQLALDALNTSSPWHPQKKQKVAIVYDVVLKHYMLNYVSDFVLIPEIKINVKLLHRVNVNNNSPFMTYSESVLNFSLIHPGLLATTVYLSMRLLFYSWPKTIKCNE
ncbi:hypothetical protein BDF21DRAFT_455962 [Thamnidium elegans]|nr:hypothetical protein BDF21DRAFT_455962 [Thamnidium elegans]